MGVYGDKAKSVLFEGGDVEGITEAAGVGEVLIADALMNLTEAERIEFLNSDECQSLLEARIIRNKTIVRMSKKDDMQRRKRLAALQIAMSKGDPLAMILAKIRKKEKEVMDKVERKYGTQAERQSRIAQREYLKKVPTLKKKGIVPMIIK